MRRASDSLILICQCPREFYEEGQDMCCLQNWTSHGVNLLHKSRHVEPNNVKKLVLYGEAASDS